MVQLQQCPRGYLFQEKIQLFFVVAVFKTIIAEFLPSEVVLAIVPAGHAYQCKRENQVLFVCSEPTIQYFLLTLMTALSDLCPVTSVLVHTKLGLVAVTSSWSQRGTSRLPSEVEFPRRVFPCDENMDTPGKVPPPDCLTTRTLHWCSEVEST